jgi:hypothetical protein
MTVIKKPGASHATRSFKADQRARAGSHDHVRRVVEQGDAGLGSVRHAGASELWGRPAPPLPLLAGECPTSLDGAAGSILPSSLLLACRLKSNDGDPTLKLPRSRRSLHPHA